MKGPSLCLACKGGRALCGQARCPLLARIAVRPRAMSLSQEFFGPSPNIFVGRMGYPNVGVGPLAALEPVPGLDSPGDWFGMDYGKVVEMRSLMLRSRQRESVFSRDRLVSDMRLLALAERPADTELRFSKKPVYEPSFSDVTQPMGPSAPLESMRITENVRVARQVDRVVSDELKAAEAGALLYEKGQDVYKITTILTSGALGLGTARKMVPTRWGITAVDDMIFRKLAAAVRDMPRLDEFLVYGSSYLDNHFQILLLPGNWEFENFEAWAPGSIWMAGMKDAQIVEEYEPYHGRTRYAEQQAGGYYAARLGVIESLSRMGRQARVVSFREVREGYALPVGVWVVRETVRNAFRRRPERFATLEEALGRIGSGLRIPVADYMKRSRILSQRRLQDFA
jgi:hypothetical protein